MLQTPFGPKKGGMCREPVEYLDCPGHTRGGFRGRFYSSQEDRRGQDPIRRIPGGPDLGRCKKEDGDRQERGGARDPRPTPPGENVPGGGGKKPEAGDLQPRAALDSERGESR